MFLIRTLFFLGALALSAAIWFALGADGRALGEVLGQMLADPWVLVTLIDLYLGFFIAAAVIFLVEENKIVAALWALPVFFLGNVWTALWLIVRLPAIARQLRSDKVRS